MRGLAASAVCWRCCKIAEAREDLYHVAEELVMEVDDLLPIVEAATLLGFAKLDKGDPVITPAGQAFAEGDILRAKFCFAMLP